MLILKKFPSHGFVFVNTLNLLVGIKYSVSTMYIYFLFTKKSELSNKKPRIKNRLRMCVHPVIMSDIK